VSQPRIRIESNDVMSHNARVFYVDSDGTETDISHCCRGVDLHIDVNERTTATLHVISATGHVSADLTEMLVTKLTGHRPWWKRTLRNVILRGYTSRRYTSA
jgi:hypothetical protein